MPLASASKTLRAQQRRSPTRDNARGGLSLALADLRAALSACDVAQFKSTLQRRLDIAKPTSASRKVLSELVPEPVKVMLDEMRQDSVMASCAPALLAWTFQLLTQCKAQACMSKVSLQRHFGCRADAGHSSCATCLPHPRPLLIAATACARSPTPFSSRRKSCGRTGS